MVVLSLFTFVFLSVRLFIRWITFVSCVLYLYCYIRNNKIFASICFRFPVDMHIISPAGQDNFIKYEK